MDTQITDFDSRLNKLEKAYADNYAATGKFPVSQQVEYTPEIKSKVGEMAPFYRFLESKGCIQGTDSSYFKIDLIVQKCAEVGAAAAHANCL